MRCLLVVLLLSLQYGSNAQRNLVPNGDFETIIKDLPCSWLVNESIHEFLMDWYTPIGTSTDIMSTAVENKCWTYAPNSGPGSFTPRSGNNSLGIINYTAGGGCETEWHEYASVELLEPLVPGMVYCVEFWVKLGNNCTVASSNIGALFTVERILRPDCNPILIEPQVNRVEPVLHVEDWVSIRGTFTATEPYRYLTIGNFFPHSETEVFEIILQEHNAAESEEEFTTLVRREIRAYTYYFLDDVSVIECLVACR